MCVRVLLYSGRTVRRRMRGSRRSQRTCLTLPEGAWCNVPEEYKTWETAALFLERGWVKHRQYSGSALPRVASAPEVSVACRGTEIYDRLFAYAYGKRLS